MNAFTSTSSRLRPLPESSFATSAMWPALRRWLMSRHRSSEPRGLAEAVDFADLERRLHAYEHEPQYRIVG